MQHWVVPAIPRFESDGWTPLRGFLKGAAVATLLALLLAAAHCTLAWFMPSFIIDDLLPATGAGKAWDRLVPWGFGINLGIGALVGWWLLETIYRTSGMVGDLCTVFAMVLAVLVLSSKHVLFAIHGVQLWDGFVIGWVWLSPEHLLFYSYGCWVGLLAVHYWRHFMEQ